jgi:Glycosyl transferase family 11
MRIGGRGRRARWETQQFVRRRWPSVDYTFPLGDVGRLGNQLWQIAGTTAIARRHGVEAFFRSNWAYRPFFALPDSRYAGRLKIARCQEAWPYATSVVEEWRSNLQDVSLWTGFESEVLAELQPSQRALDATRPFANLLSYPSTTALHVRRGDYTTKTSFHRPPQITYYEQALAMLRADVPEPTVLVFSDDHDWCRANLRLNADMHLVEGNPDWLDLTLMTRCQHHICALSTFSWWGALLSGNPSPIVPWMNVWPETFRATRPANWREIEVEPEE